MTLPVAPTKEQVEPLSEAAGTKAFGDRRPYPGVLECRIGQTGIEALPADGGRFTRGVIAQRVELTNGLWCSSSAFISRKSEVET